MQIYPQVSVTCLIYTSQRRDDEQKCLHLTANGIELQSVGSTSSELDVIPWSWILGASESTSGIRRRFIPISEGSESNEAKEIIVSGCIPKLEGSERGGLIGGLVSMVTAVLPTVLIGSKPNGVERELVQWVFRCDDEDGDLVALRTLKAIKFMADPRVKEMTKVMDSDVVMRPRKFMVVINPAGGTGNAQQIDEQQVAPVLEQGNVEVKMVITERANHATEIMKEIPLKKYDCIVAVGGDGLLSEMLPGLMLGTDWHGLAVSNPAASWTHSCGSGDGISASGHMY